MVLACLTGKADANTVQSSTTNQRTVLIPGSVVDLSQWKVTLPMDSNRDGKADEVAPPHISRILEPRFFYGNEQGQLVFTAPNMEKSIADVSRARSELRQLLNPRKTTSGDAATNNFVLASNKKSRKYGSVGSWLSATLSVNHVAVEAAHPEKKPAFSVLVGALHAGKDKRLQRSGFGYSNEPLKIYYKKWPNHEHGSLFWTYERNLETDNPNRTDIAYPIWGNTWESDANPGEQGIKLNEEFTYIVDIDEDMMHLTFTAEGKPRVEYSINLTDNVNPLGEIDDLDNPKGYSGDWFFFRVGAYNQCSSKSAPGMWFPGCGGTGDWVQDKQKGHYAQVSFSSIEMK
ncbi:hypothetical protein GCM10008940_17080 [Microbulbifer agarilyticus]